MTSLPKNADQGLFPPVADFGSGVRIAFPLATAPLSWVQDTTDAATNRMLRVTNLTGNGVAGTHSPIINNVVPSHTHNMTTGGNSVDHSHSGTTGGASANHTHSGTTATMNSNTAHHHDYPLYNADGSNVGGRGNTNFTGQYGTTNDTNIDHTHNFTTGGFSADHNHFITTGGASTSHTHSGTTDSGSSNTNWQPRYIDLIICTRT
jgi:hypothetical protein